MAGDQSPQHLISFSEAEVSSLIRDVQDEPLDWKSTMERYWVSLVTRQPLISGVITMIGANSVGHYSGRFEDQARHFEALKEGAASMGYLLDVFRSATPSTLACATELQNIHDANDAFGCQTSLARHCLRPGVDDFVDAYAHTWSNEVRPHVRVGAGVMVKLAEATLAQRLN